MWPFCLLFKNFQVCNLASFVICIGVRQTPSDIVSGQIKVGVSQYNYKLPKEKQFDQEHKKFLSMYPLSNHYICMLAWKALLDQSFSSILNLGKQVAPITCSVLENELFLNFLFVWLKSNFQILKFIYNVQ